MLGWFRALMPKAERFFDLFEAHAQQIRAGALALREVLNGGPDISRHCQAIIAAGKTLVDCIPLLRQVGHEANRLTAQTEAIGRKESEIDDLYDLGRRELFTTFRTDPMTY